MQNFHMFFMVLLQIIRLKDHQLKIMLIKYQRNIDEIRVHKISIISIILYLRKTGIDNVKILVINMVLHIAKIEYNKECLYQLAAKY